MENFWENIQETNRLIKETDEKIRVESQKAALMESFWISFWASFLISFIVGLIKIKNKWNNTALDLRVQCLFSFNIFYFFYIIVI